MCPDNHDIATANRKGLIPKLSGSSSDALLGDGTFGAATGFKAGTFTRDLSTASGNQSITGVGFKPRAMVVFGAVDAGVRMALGVTDGSNSYCIYDLGNTAAGQWGVKSSGSVLLFFDNVADDYSGALSSMDSDGFTIAWTKTGSPTGTVTMFYLALR